MGGQALQRPLRGIIPPIATPLNSDRGLDLEGLARLVNHLRTGGVHGLFILGTTGEGPSLSQELQREMIIATCKLVKGAIPVLVGITGTSPADSISLAGVAREAGASALVAAPPFYFNSDQREVVAWFEYLADHVDLPIFLYNIPSLVKTSLEPDTIRKLAGHEKVIGLKDSSGNGGYFSTVLSAMQSDESFSLFVGPDEMLAPLLLTGAHGGVSAGANMFPRLYVDLYDAAVARKLDQLRALHEKVMQISRLIYHGVPATTGYLKGIKCALSLMGICGDTMEFPLIPLAGAEKDTIRKNLAELDLGFPKQSK